MSVSFITKRKITKAIALAVADRKIPDLQPDFYRWGDEAGLVWESLDISAPIRVRTDGTIYVSHASAFERGSHFDRTRTGFVLVK